MFGRKHCKHRLQMDVHCFGRAEHGGKRWHGADQRRAAAVAWCDPCTTEACFKQSMLISFLQAATGRTLQRPVSGSLQETDQHRLFAIALHQGHSTPPCRTPRTWSLGHSTVPSPLVRPHPPQGSTPNALRPPPLCSMKGSTQAPSLPYLSAHRSRVAGCRQRHGLPSEC